MALELSCTPPPRLPARRLGRSALFSFGATVAATVAASALLDCSDTGTFMAAYGVPCAPDCVATGGTGASPSDAASEPDADEAGGQAGASGAAGSDAGQAGTAGAGGSEAGQAGTAGSDAGADANGD